MELSSKNLPSLSHFWSSYFATGAEKQPNMFILSKQFFIFFFQICIHHYIVFNYFSLFTLFYYTLLLELNFCKIILICQNNEISPKNNFISFLFHICDLIVVRILQVNGVEFTDISNCSNTLIFCFFSKDRRQLYLQIT